MTRSDSKSNILYALLLGFGVILLIVLSIALLTARQGDGEQANARADRTTASIDGPYTDLSGAPVSLGAFDGKILVVNAWASWCPFCIDELSDFNTLAKTYADQGVVVIAINRAESPDTVRAYIEHIGSPEHIVFLLDPSDHFYKTIGGFSMPETQVYNREGALITHRRGAVTYQDMNDLITKAFSESE